MKALILILSFLFSPSVVMSGQTSVPAPKTATPAEATTVSFARDPFALLTQPSSLFADTAALITDKESLGCLARTIYFEARGEPVAGQMAVASVVLARVASVEFPDTVCEVVTEARKPGKFHCQFTWWCDGRTDEPKNAEEYRRALGIAMFAMLIGPQPGGPTHFHAANMQPKWDLDQVARIGGHVFYN